MCGRAVIRWMYKTFYIDKTVVLMFCRQTWNSFWVSDAVNFLCSIDVYVVILDETKQKRSFNNARPGGARCNHFKLMLGPRTLTTNQFLTKTNAGTTDIQPILYIFASFPHTFSFIENVLSNVWSKASKVFRQTVYPSSTECVLLLNSEFCNIMP